MKNALMRWLKDIEHASLIDSEPLELEGEFNSRSLCSIPLSGKSRRIGHRAVQTVHSARTPQRRTSTREAYSQLTQHRGRSSVLTTKHAGRQIVTCETHSCIFTRLCICCCACICDYICVYVFYLIFKYIYIYIYIYIFVHVDADV